MKIIIAYSVFFLALFNNSFGQINDLKMNHSNGSNIFYLNLPPNISSEQIKNPNQEQRNILRRYANEKLRLANKSSDSLKSDVIIVYVDENNRPILPDLMAAQSSNAESVNELTFIFDSTIMPWDSARIIASTTQLNDFYPVAKAIYGNPAFNIDVHILLDTSINYAGMYNPSTNEITLYDTSNHVLCHEMIHAFHDDNIIYFSTYEEGMTRAVEIEVFNQLVDYLHWDEHHSYRYDYYYEALNRPNIACRYGSLFYNSNLLFLKYQMSSMIWSKMYIEDENYFKKFNDTLYTRILIDPTIINSDSSLRDLVFQSIQNVENTPVSVWYEKQNLLNVQPDSGYFLYQRINQFTIDYFYRDQFGAEYPQGNSNIHWDIYDHNANLIDSGSAISTSYGWTSIPNAPFPGYIGRLKVVASVLTPNGLISDTVYRNGELSDGIFGTVEDANSGVIRITPLDSALNSESALLTNGSFSFPNFEHVRGRFLIDYTYPDCRHILRTITKDASHYYVRLAFDSSLVISDWTSIQALDSTTFCAGDSALLAANLVGGYSYQWLMNDTLILGEVDSLFAAKSSGIYSVIISDGVCVDTSNSIQIQANSLPSVYLGNDTVLTTGFSITLDAGFGFYSYLWSTGETTQTIQVNYSDTLYVTVSDSNSCINSDSIAVNITTNINVETNSLAIQIFPNPSKGHITISSQDEMHGDIIIEISDYLGKVVYYERFLNDGGNLRHQITADFNEGVYLIRIKHGKDFSVQKLIY
jgi:hypothetical protein